MSSKWVRVGSVRRFDLVFPSFKPQALKPLEEAAEVFGAWQEMERERDKCLAHGNESSGDGNVVAMRECLLDSCADVIQATLNLVAALGVEDFRPWMKACERRNRERGRITDGYAVRRLTPRECERLQGLPDDWTKVPYRGKPADECPDTPRYKAIGNSMAVNVMRWLGERIQEVSES